MNDNTICTPEARWNSTLVFRVSSTLGRGGFNIPVMPTKRKSTHRRSRPCGDRVTREGRRERPVVMWTTCLPSMIFPWRREMLDVKICDDMSNAGWKRVCWTRETWSTMCKNELPLCQSQTDNPHGSIRTGWCWERFGWLGMLLLRIQLFFRLLQGLTRIPTWLIKNQFCPYLV